MTTTISTEIENRFIGKLIKCYEWLDDWGDVVYSLEPPTDEYQIVLKQICNIKLNHTMFTITFEDNKYIDIWSDEEFELYDKF